MTPRCTLTASMCLSILYIFVFYNRYNQEIALARSLEMVERKAAEKKAVKQRKKRPKHTFPERERYLYNEIDIVLPNRCIYFLTKC